MFKKKYSYNARPLPEILDGEDWEVRNSGDVRIAYVDFGKREFVVPFETSAAGELVRAHEAMHVKISPQKASAMKDTDFVTMQSIEDCRVWHGLRLVDIPTDKAQVHSNKKLETIYKENEGLKHPQRLADSAFCVMGNAEENKVRELINQNDPSGGKILEVVDEIAEKYFKSEERKGNLPPFESTVAAAKELTERIKLLFPEMPPPPKSGDKNSKGQRGNLTESFEFGSNDSDKFKEIAAMTKEEAKEARELGLPEARMLYKGEFHYSNKFGEPGKLRPIEKPKLDSHIRFKTTKVVKQNASDEGIIPVRMNRYATDMRLFNRKGKRRAGAAVLIDVSGSMSLSSDEVKQIIHQCPASIVAIYSGFTNDGILRIIAEGGRYTEKLNDGMPGSNIVDAPALEWLAKRKESKKLWISDGWVTCTRESQPYPHVIRRMTNLLRDKRIERVGNVRELLKSGKLIDHAFDDGHEIGRGYKKEQVT